MYLREYLVVRRSGKRKRKRKKIILSNILGLFREIWLRLEGHPDDLRTWILLMWILRDGFYFEENDDLDLCFGHLFLSCFIRHGGFGKMMATNKKLTDRLSWSHHYSHNNTHAKNKNVVVARSASGRSSTTSHNTANTILPSPISTSASAASTATTSVFALALTHNNNNHDNNNEITGIENSAADNDQNNNNNNYHDNDNFNKNENENVIAAAAAAAVGLGCNRCTNDHTNKENNDNDNFDNQENVHNGYTKVMDYAAKNNNNSNNNDTDATNANGVVDTTSMNDNTSQIREQTGSYPCRIKRFCFFLRFS